MRRLVRPLRNRASLSAALRDDSGGSLVEFAIVLALFLLLFFGLIDFGRLGYSWVFADKAMQRAARIAAVRPAVCDGVPETYARGAVPAGSTPPEFGTSCSAGATTCLDPGNITCTGNQATTSAGIATATEVWNSIAGLMPTGTTIANVRFTYSFDSNLGFLGGPYVPVVTTQLDDASFTFVSPLAGLATMAGATGSTIPSSLTIPPMSVSLPGEDLAQGNSG